VTEDRPILDLIVEVEKAIRSNPDPATAARVIVGKILIARRGPAGAPPGASLLDSLLSFPCDGDPDSWPFTVYEKDRLAGAFPAVDVLDEARRALAWIEALPARRKTHDGMRRFLTSWMARVPVARGADRMIATGKAPPPAGEVTRLGDRVAETDRKLAIARREAEIAAASWPRDEHGNMKSPREAE
jgi:hypothetical protein